MTSNVLELPKSARQPELISEYYREQNKQLHAIRSDYGSNGHRYASQIRELATAMGTKEILDYGAGKRTLEDALVGLDVRSYDPAFEDIAAPPEPADLVVCGDVLEHIEPEYLDAVLDDLKRVTKKCLFATIATRPAVKTLPDGRNTHLIQQDMRWWLPHIWDRFIIGSMHNMGGELLLICGAMKGD